MLAVRRLRARWRLGRLIRAWLRYRSIVEDGLAEEPLDPRRERAFLRLKARIAAMLDFVPSIVPTSLQVECRQEMKAISELLKSHSSLLMRAPGERWDPELFLQTWHQHYIYLTGLMGTRLGKVSLRGMSRNESVPTGFGKPYKVRSRQVGLWVNGTVRVAVGALSIYFLASALGVGRNRSGRFELNFPGSITQAGDNFVGALNSVMSGVVGFVAPLIEVYGALGTGSIALILLLAIGYWTFVRVA